VLVTTLLDPVAYPAEALADLYLQRWQVELHFRELKPLLRLDVLRCRSPQMIRKELLMHFIAYNLVRAVMLQAALQYQVELSRLEFQRHAGHAAGVCGRPARGRHDRASTGRPGARAAAADRLRPTAPAARPGRTPGQKTPAEKLPIADQTAT
jgi:Transposase DDE domain